MTPDAARTPAERASPLLRQRIRAVFKQLPKGLAGDEEAIHQMRVAGRRLRAALPLLARRPGGKRVKRALRVLRELTRAAGQSRDLDVSLELLQEHLLAPKDPAPMGPGGEVPGAQEIPTAEQKKLRQRLRSAST